MTDTEPLTAARIVDTLIDHNFIAPGEDGRAMLAIMPLIEAAALRSAREADRDAAGRSPEWYEGYNTAMQDNNKVRRSAREAEPTDHADIRSRHHLDEPYTDLDGSKAPATWCAADNQHWPCDAVQLLAARPATQPEPSLTVERLAEAMAAAEGDFVGKGSIWLHKAEDVLHHLASTPAHEDAP